MLQGWDSVELKSDLTVIGLDQKFNELQARPLQEESGQVPQDLVMMPLLVGIDGVNKMSQSLGNYIGIADPAIDQFGKVMSIPDSLIYSYFELCTRVSAGELSEIEKELKSGSNPRDLKARLAKEIVGIYHGAAAASGAEDEFNKIFRDKGKPSDMPEFKLTEATALDKILVDSGLVASKSEVRRLVEQGGIRRNDVVLNSWLESDFNTGDIIQIGKRKFLRIIK
jgi:tyrosyl-tRNA synthetase